MARDTTGPRSIGPRGPRSRFPPGDPRGLEAAIRDPTIRAQIYGLTQQSLRALEGLSRLDDKLYTRFMEAGSNTTEDPAAIALLRRVAAETFRGTRVLLAGLARLRPADSEADGPPSEVQDLDFDLGSEQMPTAEPATASFEDPGPEGPDFGDLDIDNALDTIDADERDEPSRWAELKEKATAIEYGIRSQTAEFDARFVETVEASRYAAALEGLDDSRSSIGEGVVALLVAIYQAFQPEVDASLVAPGYLSSLARALLVRRSLADLAAAVEPQNAVVQRDGSAPEERDAALGRVRAALSQFVLGPGFKAMRPGDRWELSKFDRAFTETSAAESRMISEGFAKYLDSLGSINRREVLITHDQRTIHDMREQLSAARPLLEYNTGVARDMVKQALASAQQLYGRTRSSDELIAALREADPTMATAAEVEAVLSTLELLLDDGS